MKYAWFSQVHGGQECATGRFHAIDSRRGTEMKFPDLISQISNIDEAARSVAGRTLQQILSLRNWLIGASLVEFEQAGEDRAQYGQRLMHTLAQALGEAGCQGLSASNLKNFRQLALAYPGLDAIDLGRRLSLPIESGRVVGIRQTSGEFAPGSENRSANSASSPFPSLARRGAEEELPWRDASWLARLFTTLTFSHLLELSRIDELTQRAFYELHCLKERWSVRELQRQRDSLLYERIGLSDKRDEVLKLARDGALAESPAAQLRDPYVFEFLGIERRGVMAESASGGRSCWSSSTVLFELGRDFCFVARQFRISSGTRHHYIDLLLFHRRLRCLVAIDLKMGAFQPEHAGQLRFYVNHLAEHVAYPEENPPVGILLCAERDAEVVRFATAGDEDVFVTRYQLELPTESQLKVWLHEERARLELTGVDAPGAWHSFVERRFSGLLSV
jgi:predicted nuclease of restriction endonuclease-like (RecB) superfamily